MALIASSKSSINEGKTIRPLIGRSVTVMFLRLATIWSMLSRTQTKSNTMPMFKKNLIIKGKTSEAIRIIAVLSPKVLTIYRSSIYEIYLGTAPIIW